MAHRAKVKRRSPGDKAVPLAPSEEWRRLDHRLGVLTEKAVLSQEEQLDEIAFKKEKLRLKDRMEAIARQARETQRDTIDPDHLETIEVERQLERALQETPVEAGVAHPAEPMIERWLADERSAGKRLISAFHTLKPAAIRAYFLLLLGRAVAGAIPDWAYTLTGTALQLPSIEVRDAAVRVLETWATARAEELLRSHAAQGGEVRWLTNYIEEILPLARSTPA